MAICPHINEDIQYNLVSWLHELNQKFHFQTYYVIFVLFVKYFFTKIFVKKKKEGDAKRINMQTKAKMEFMLSRAYITKYSINVKYRITCLI